MTLDLAADALLALLILGLGIWTVAARKTYRATLGFVAYGLLVAVVWLRLGSADVALAEAALSSGLTGLLMLGAAARLRGAHSAPTVALGLRLAAGALAAAVAAGLAAVVLLLPEPAPNLVPAAMANLPSTGLGNAVTGVLLAYRSIDTLLEKIVLLLVLIGLWSLAADRDWGGRPTLRLARPGSALVLLAQLLPPLGIVVGIHLLWVGANAPGGAFQGGAVLAAVWILAMLAGLLRPPASSGRTLRWLAVAGPLFFLAVGVAGFFLTGEFLAYPEGYAKPLIVASEVAITLSVAVVLALLLAGPPQPLERSEPVESSGSEP